MFTYEKGVVIVKSVSERVDFEGKHEQEEAGKRIHRNEKMRIEAVLKKIEGSEPISGSNHGNLYKISDSCYVFRANDLRIIIGNSPDISDYYGINDPTSVYTYLINEKSNPDHYPNSGIYIVLRQYENHRIMHVIRDGGVTVAGAAIDESGRGAIVDYTKMEIGTDGTILHQPEQIDIGDRPELDTLHDFIVESILTEEGRTEKEGTVMRVLKNDYAGILEQMDVDIEHIPEEEMRAVEMRRRDERLSSEVESLRDENHQLSARNEAIDGRAKEEVGALRAEVEKLKTELETSREETKSEKRKFKALVDAIGRAMEKARNAGRLTSPKAIVEMIKAEIAGQVKDAPDASDNGEDR